eukprot:SAG31_NODE_46348_length_255_cov_0.525641_1_plen_59_part_10
MDVNKELQTSLTKLSGTVSHKEAAVEAVKIMAYRDMQSKSETDRPSRRTALSLSDILFH